MPERLFHLDGDPELADAIADAAVAERLRSVAGRKMVLRAAEQVDVVPVLPEPDQRPAFAVVERFVVNGRHDDALLRAETAKPVLDEKFGRLGGAGPGRCVAEELLDAVQPVARLSQGPGDAVVDAVAGTGEQVEDLPVDDTRPAQDFLGQEERAVGLGGVVRQCGVEGERPQLGGEQGGGVVVNPAVEVAQRAPGVLVGGRPQLRCTLSSHLGAETGVEVDEPKTPCLVQQNVLGLQVAVRPVVGEQPGRQLVEALRQPGEGGRVSDVLRPFHHVVQRVPLDPVVRHHADPFAVAAVRMEEELFGQEAASVQRGEVHGGPAGVTAQTQRAFAEADFENDGAVADVEDGPPRLVATELHAA